MSPALSIAASLSPDIRQDIGIQVLARTEPISHIASTHQVSRKFVYQQGDKAQQALDESFAGMVQGRVTLLIWRYSLKSLSGKTYRDFVRYESVTLIFWKLNQAVNPTGIVPIGSQIDFSSPHNRGT